ncbi:MAG TPA: proline dehydrogenase family protein [Salinimicrobium sp.]|nr:proline dehydrogenase family protein [Salinimicrobium sp.]
MITSRIFNDTKTAFSLKTNADIERGLFLFRMIKNPTMVKIGTGLTTFALKLGLPVEGLIKKTIFNQFCGGVTEQDCIPVIEMMYSRNLHSILDYSVEGNNQEEELNAALQKKVNIVKFISKREELPFAVFKPTGIGEFAIWQKVSEKEQLTDEEEVKWGKIVERVEKMCAVAAKNNVRLLVDAEESWIQNAVDEIVERMMEKYNKEKPLIFNTIQCYRWDRLQYLKMLHQKGIDRGFKIGAKIVRGAYMEKEDARAKRKGYPSPICENKEATDVNFNAVLTYILSNLNEISIFIGTHNEVSNYLAMQLMEEKGIEKNDNRVWFSQLYGMSDHISYNLAKMEYNVAKLVPFGPVKEVVPYLIRRAQENTSVQGQTGRELSLLEEEKKRRKGKYFHRKIE